MEDPAWSRVYCVHEIWVWSSEVFLEQTVLDSPPERTLCAVMNTPPKKSSAVLAGSWLCTALEKDWWHHIPVSPVKACAHGPGSALQCPAVHWLDLTKQDIPEQCSNWGSLEPLGAMGRVWLSTHTHLSHQRSSPLSILYPKFLLEFCMDKRFRGKKVGVGWEGRRLLV